MKEVGTLKSAWRKTRHNCIETGRKRWEPDLQGAVAIE